jgi:DNA polymerase III alpha subunit
MLMKTDELGIPRFSNKDLINMIYSGNVDKCHVVLCDESDDVNLFNKAAKEQGLSELTKYIPIDVEQKDFDNKLQSEWFMPDEQRMELEYHEYEDRGMLNLLCYMVYLVSFMRENDIVWGVGRGSSVASYILYLIGVHKVDSIQYGLDFNEFMR